MFVDMDTLVFPTNFLIFFLSLHNLFSLGKGLDLLIFFDNLNFPGIFEEFFISRFLILLKDHVQLFSKFEEIPFAILCNSDYQLIRTIALS